MNQLQGTVCPPAGEAWRRARLAEAEVERLEADFEASLKAWKANSAHDAETIAELARRLREIADWGFAGAQGLDEAAVLRRCAQGALGYLFSRRVTP